MVSLLTAAVPATAGASLLGSDSDSSDGPNVIEYAEGPSFVVELKSSEAAADLEEWTNASGRHLVEVDNETGVAVVSGPRGLIDADASFWVQLTTGGLFGDPLEASSFVADISPNYRLEVDPLTSTALTNVSRFSAPESEASGWLSSEAMPHEGMAFSSEANRTTMSESRSILGADNVSATGAGVTVAVADTGIKTANGRTFGEDGMVGSELRVDDASKNLLTNETVAADGIDAVEDGSSSRHGTWAAAAVAGDPSGTTHDGVAPDANLLVLKALGDDGSGSTADITRAIRYASQEEADVISMSLGSPVQSPAIDRAIVDAREAGSVVVVAAGNSRQSTRWLASPADSEEAIAVGATNGEAPADAESAYFSQIGPDPGTLDNSGAETAGATVDLAAPGMATVTRIPTADGVVENKSLSGTSMATPMVAGGIAVALEANDWSADEATEKAREAARPVPNAGTTEVGAGMFAVDYLVDGTEPEATQEDARTDGAVTRDETYRSLSDSSGGIITGLLG
ncbi:S8 family serine peptidase [Halosimplex pelagicum]|uniref:S8 family serine peptidase n=1 Tax=Halosimplex pelagicum TaxID=869886 RepID=A0A7D5PCK6_9EURY|nr:S8 family serine peptidase [Halosimplex pelagicum]QLH83405.1 S8 family serine peptidase [Halosimplex pelagicum]